MKTFRCLALVLAFLAAPSLRAGGPPAFASVEAQIAQANARPGSALAALIRANQDVSVLTSSEADDGLSYPVWLRVLYRKSHPETAAFDPVDPTKGYPHVLHEVYEWMTTHQDLRPGPGIEAEAGAAEEAVAPLALAVGGNLRTSGAQTSARSESDVRINFWDPSKILQASNNISAGGQQAQFRSTDSGASWSQSYLPLYAAGNDAFHSDPAVDWTSDGTAWSLTMGITSNGNTLKVRSYRSTDYGATWAFEGTPSGSQTNTDKELMWVDHSNGSPYKDRVYAIWHNGNPAFANRRTAGAAGTWLAAPVQVSASETTGTAIGSDIKTNAAGDVFAFWPATSNRRIIVAKSTTGGDSWAAPVIVATAYDAYDIGVPSFANRRALIYVSGGAYKSGLTNNVYATWTDLSGVTGCTAAANEPGTNASSPCTTRIWFARSTDGGATWGAPAKVNEDGGLHDQFNQWLAVDETTGELGLMYYDTKNDPARKKTDVRYQSSFDGGVTWTCPVKVTTSPTDETVAGADSGNQYGDYNGLSGYAATFFPSWTDRRNALREEIWTAKLTTTPEPGVPAIGTVSATASNQLSVTFGAASPAAVSYTVYRAPGTCASPGTFAVVGFTAASPYVDNAVVNGSSYAYRIASVDANGCEVAPLSGCAGGTASAACVTPPTFAGLASATAGSCAIGLSWSAATPTCSGPVTYDVYRSTASGFTPSVANRVATGLSGTSYSDASALVNGTAYYYVVRAVDAGNGAGETNLVQRSAVAAGCGAKLYTLAPCRLLDTRDPAGALGGPALAGSGGTRTFALAATCGVPADALALSVNVTVANTAAAGDLRLYAGGTGAPGTTVINFRAGQVRANNAIVKVSTGGTASVTVLNDAPGTVDFLLDVNGFFR